MREAKAMNKLTKIVGLVTVILYLCTFVSADQTGMTRKPPRLKGGEKAEPIPPEHYQILNTEFGRQSIIDIEAVLGHANLYDKGGMAFGICYVSSDGVFLEYHFTDQSIGYQVSRSPGQSVPPDRCIDLPVHSSAMANRVGLAIGIPRAQIHQLLGTPSNTSPDETEYKYVYWIQKKAAQDVADKYRKANDVAPDIEVWTDVYSVIKIVFEEDKVTSYDVSTSETLRI